MDLSELLEDDTKDLVIIYPGRFHPFHIGHGKVYKYLKQKYSNAKVFISTSGKVDGDRSPFTFEEKKKMMVLAGVDSGAIVQCKSPYQSIEIVQQFDENKTVVVFAVSEKDMEEEPRFDFSDGIKLKKNGEPAYMQKWSGLDSAETYREHGYIATTPTFPFEVLGQKINSASQIRNMIAASDDTKLTQMLQDLYNITDVPQDIIEIFKRKIGNKETMNENWSECSLSEFLIEIEHEEKKMKKGILQTITEGYGPMTWGRMKSIAADMKDYVDDHKEHFDAYPQDIEIDDKIYDWDEYWEILDKVYPDSYDNQYAVESVTTDKDDKLASLKVSKPSESSYSDKQIRMAFGILNDPRYRDGNYSGAVAAIEKLAKGLSNHPSVAKALKRANESIDEEFDRRVKEVIEAKDNSVLSVNESKDYNLIAQRKTMNLSNQAIIALVASLYKQLDDKELSEVKVKEHGYANEQHEQLEYIHHVLQECGGGNVDTAMVDQAIEFVEDIREQHFNADGSTKSESVNEDKMTNDDMRDIAIRCVDEMVSQGLIPDDLDTDNQTEFQVQDIIHDQLMKVNHFHRPKKVDESQGYMDLGNIVGYLDTIDEYVEMLFKSAKDKKETEIAYRIQNAVDDIRTRELGLKPSNIRDRFNEDDMNYDISQADTRVALDWASIDGRLYDDILQAFEDEHGEGYYGDWVITANKEGGVDESLENVEEATHDEAKPIYDLVGDLGAGDKPLADVDGIFHDLVRYLDGDTIKNFVADFRRNNDLNYPGEDGDYGEDDKNFEATEEVQLERLGALKIGVLGDPSTDTDPKSVKKKAVQKKKPLKGSPHTSGPLEEIDELKEGKYRGYEINRQNRKDGHPLIVPALKLTGTDMKDIKHQIDRWLDESIEEGVTLSGGVPIAAVTPAKTTPKAKAKADAQNKASDAKLIKKAQTKDVNRKRNYNDDGIAPPKGHHNNTSNRWAESTEELDDDTLIQIIESNGMGEFVVLNEDGKLVNRDELLENPYVGLLALAAKAGQLAIRLGKHGKKVYTNWMKKQNDKVLKDLGKVNVDKKTALGPKYTHGIGTPKPYRGNLGDRIHNSDKFYDPKKLNLSRFSEETSPEGEESIEQMQNAYKYNEERNNHSENILMLAQAFGDRGEIRAVEGLLKVIKRQGHVTPDQSEMMYNAIHKKYYSQLFPTENEGNEFSGELAKAKIDGKKEFKVDGKTYKVKEALIKLIDKQKFVEGNILHYSDAKGTPKYSEGYKAARKGVKYDENPYSGAEKLQWSKGHNDFRADKLRAAGEPNYGARGQFESKK